jgi:hypothetical protein
LHVVEELGVGVAIEREGRWGTVEVYVVRGGGKEKGIGERGVEVEIEARFFGNPITGT